MSDEFNGDNGDPSSDGVEMVVVSDESGRGVFVSCGAQLAPADLVAGLCEIISQVTKAVIERPHISHAGDLNLGDYEEPIN